MDQTTGKLMTMHKALHPRDDVNRLYMSRKEERGVTSIKNSIYASIQRLNDYLETPGRRQITITRNNADNIRTNQKTKMG